MRWPIYLQILLPVLLAVVLAIGTSSALTAQLAAKAADRQRRDALQRVTTSLTDAAFPLTRPVLERMRELSGAHFVVLDPAGQVSAATIQLSGDESRLLRDLPLRASASPAEASSSRRISLQLQLEQYLADRLLVQRTGGPGGQSLVVLYPEEHRAAMIRQALVPPLLVGGCATVVVMLVTALLARRLVSPIEQLRRQAAAVAEGDFTPVEILPRNDEIRDLAVSINQMLQRLEHSADQLRRHERLRTLGQLGGGIAHQVRNSATGARMALDLHRRECPLEPGCEALETASRQLVLMETYLQRFLTLGRARPQAFQVVDLTRLVNDLLPLVRPACGHANIELNCVCHAQRVLVLADPAGLEQMLINLLLNAIEAASRASPAAGRVTVEFGRSDGDQAVVSIQDTGAGPAAAIAARIFEPLVSEKADGAGLGLTVARQIAEEHGGSLTWERQGAVTCFLVRLPTVGQAFQPDMELEVPRQLSGWKA